MATWIGYFAATCTTLAFLPQVMHILKTRDTSGISLSMYSIFCLGISCWLIYGLLITNWPIILANLFTLTLASIILTMLIINHRQ